MKNPVIRYSIAFIGAVAICAFALVGCSGTPAQQASRQQILTEFNAFAAQAKPIVDATLVAVAQSKGISPTQTEAAIAASDQLYGMASQAWAGQPITQGASLTSVATAVLPLLPQNATTKEVASILTAAAAKAAPAP